MILSSLPARDPRLQTISLWMAGYRPLDRPRKVYETHSLSKAHPFLAAHTPGVRNSSRSGLGSSYGKLVLRSEPPDVGVIGMTCISFQGPSCWVLDKYATFLFFWVHRFTCHPTPSVLHSPRSPTGTQGLFLQDSIVRGRKSRPFFFPLFFLLSYWTRGLC